MRAVLTVVVPDTPPAIKTAPLDSSVDVWPCTAAGSALVAVQVVVPFQTSADARDAEPLEPPDTSTVPGASTPALSKVAVCCCRAAVIVPAEPQLPIPEAAAKSSVELCVVVPDRPPVIRTLPLARAVSV